MAQPVAHTVVFYAPSATARDDDVAGLVAPSPAVSGRPAAPRPYPVQVVACSSVAEAEAAVKDAAEANTLAAVVSKLGSGEGLPFLRGVAKAHARVFTILYSRTASRDPFTRIAAMSQHTAAKKAAVGGDDDIALDKPLPVFAAAGERLPAVHMVTHAVGDAAEAIRRVTMMPPAASPLRRQPRQHLLLDGVPVADLPRCAGMKPIPGTHAEPSCKCPVCGMADLTPQELWVHLPLFHVNAGALGNTPCPICHHAGASGVGGWRCLIRHVAESHKPYPASADTSRQGVPLYAFGLTVVRRKRDGKFLVVQEKYGDAYWLPGGGIDAGEFPKSAAERECVEEVGIRVNITGILRVECSPTPRGCRMRYIFFGEPAEGEDDMAKTVPDFESVGAAWVSAEEIQTLPLRSDEPLEWFKYIAAGGRVHPLAVLTPEGAPVAMVT